MLRVPRLVGVGLALTVMVGAAGCTSGPDPAGSPLATQDTQEDQAVASAEQVLRARQVAWSECLADPPSSDELCFDQVSTGTLLEDEREMLRNAQDYMNRYTGELEISDVEVEAVVLDAEPPRVVLSACIDSTTWAVIQSDGTLLSLADQPHYRAIYTIINERYPSPTGWRVSDAARIESEDQC